MNGDDPYYQLGAFKLCEQEVHQLVGQIKRRATQIRPRVIGGGIFGRSFKLR